MIDVVKQCHPELQGIPADWTVVSKVNPVLGGVADKTRPPKHASRHRLVLRGLVVMAGLEIKN